jgi:hypothetical protein
VKNGWRVIHTQESEDGLSILNLETQVLRWLRKELKLPQHLGAEEMGRFGGGSETFSIDGVSADAVIDKINQLVAKQTK